MTFKMYSTLESPVIYSLFLIPIFSFINSYCLAEQARYINLTRPKNVMVSKAGLDWWLTARCLCSQRQKLA